MNNNDELYVGWEPKPPVGIGRRMRRIVAALLVLTVLVGVVLASAQRLIGVSVFEWGQTKRFSGMLELWPYPRLLLPRPGQAADALGYSTYPLVAPWKFGLKTDTLGAFEHKPVALEGTLIYRAGQTMIEVRDGSIHQPTSVAPELESLKEQAEDLGRQTFVGEIVDSKCFFGVMNPGQLITHRACAIRCISGGVPPVLLVRGPAGRAVYLLLVSLAGRPVNAQVLDLVAEPVEITGNLLRRGELLILQADPTTIRRVSQ